MVSIQTLRRRRSGAESILSHRIYHNITVTGKRIDILYGRIHIYRTKFKEPQTT